MIRRHDPRLLIANRGEIALRIIRACRELGIESVAVYSDADVDAPHVAAADRAGAHRPGAGRRELPVDAAHPRRRAATGADAVHPGYGFLSENAGVRRRLRARRHRLRRPARRGHRADGIEDRGAAADAGRRRAGRAGRDAGRSVRRRHPARRRARRPARARQGVGRRRRQGHAPHRRGRRASTRRFRRRGARRWRRSATARSTSSASFERPRHVEVQIFADHHGHVVHLFERECSVQRRHQKVIEESPSPALTPRAARAHDRRGRRARRARPDIATRARSSFSSTVDRDAGARSTSSR